MRVFVLLASSVCAASAVATQSSYVVSDSPMSWQDAREWSESVGGHLVCIGSEQEDSLVRSLVGPDRQYWLGFSDAASEGNWTWVTGEPVLFTGWQQGEPNNAPSASDGSGEDFAMAYSSGGSGWWDYPSPLYGINTTFPVLAYAVAEFPPPAQPDRNGDGLVNGQDLAIILGFWGQCSSVTCLGDANFDGLVDGEDLGIVLGAWTG